MIRKTKRNHQEQKEQKEQKGVHTIPAIRRAFEHIESFVDERISYSESQDKIAKALQKEWLHTFLKPLPKKSAIEFVQHRVSSYSGEISHKKRSKHRTLRRKGGSAILSGAPLDSSLGPGLFLAPNSPPNSAGHLPMSNGSPSSFGSYVDYITSGFRVPDMSSKSGPIQGQPLWPIPSMFGGKRKLKRASRTSGGGPLDTVGSLLSQAIMHPIPSSNPASIALDGQNSVFGVVPNVSSDQVQRTPMYQMGAVYPKPMSF